MSKFYGLLVTSCLGLGACGIAELPADSSIESILSNQCAQTSSTKAEYFARQGQRLQGLTGASFVVQGARTGCQTVDGLNTTSGDLSGTTSGQIMTSTDFQGAVLQVVDSTGVRGDVAVTQVEADPMDQSGQTSLFTLMALDPVTGVAKNVCAPDPNGKAAAIPLRGSWDTSGAFQADGSLQFYCTGGVIAKCIRWGYRPWQSSGGTSLKDAHQACTRMARADYCGDGQTHTQEGTQIDMYDNLGVHRPQTLSLFFEATWTPQGAYCVARGRWLSVSGLLGDSCRSQFELALQSSPQNSADLCLMHRIGSPAASTLLSNRTGINLGLF